MKWWEFFIRRATVAQEHVEDSMEVQKAEENLRDLEAKIAKDKGTSPDLAKAVASARRVEYRVHTFTQEISDSFRRFNHG